MMRVSAALAWVLIISACALPEGNTPPAEPQPNSICLEFIERTEPLGELTDLADYTELMNEAARPIYDHLLVFDYDMPGEAIESWENLAHGQPTNHDFEAVHYLGGLLAAEIGLECEELGRNVGTVPLLALEGAAPPVEVVPIYAEGTPDHSCDVFLQTLFGWSDARSHGEEIGKDIASLADDLGSDLTTAGIDDGIEDLAAYASLYRSFPIVRAHEEAEIHLADAAAALASHSIVCAHLSTWDHQVDDEDRAYHEFRWDRLGYDAYTLRIVIPDADPIRGEIEAIVVVDNGVPIRTVDLRTGAEGTLQDVTWTVEELFQRTSGDTWFHPVLGYPTNGPGWFVNELSPGLEFDQSVVGSTADATTPRGSGCFVRPGKEVRGGRHRSRPIDSSGLCPAGSSPIGDRRVVGQPRG